MQSYGNEAKDGKDDSKRHVERVQEEQLTVPKSGSVAGQQQSVDRQEVFKESEPKSFSASEWREDRRRSYPVTSFAPHPDQSAGYYCPVPRQPYAGNPPVTQPPYHNSWQPWCQPSYVEYYPASGYYYPPGQTYSGHQSRWATGYSNQNPYEVTSAIQGGGQGSGMRRYLSSSELSVLVKQFRVWKSTKSGRELNPRLLSDRKLTEQSFKFNLTSYNILSQDLLDFHRNLYTSCQPSALRWKDRFAKLADEMVKLRSSIYCLQEVNERHYVDDLAPFFESLGYVSLYKRRPNKLDGCVIAYDDKRFKLVKINYLELNRTSVHRNLDRENVAIIGLFEPKNSHLASKDAKIVVATTHLLFNPKRGDIKINQLRLLLAQISQMARKNGPEAGCSMQNGHNGAEAMESSAMNGLSDQMGLDHYPVILCGDFNTLPGSPIHQFVIKGKLDAIGLKSGDLSGQHDGIDKGNRVTQSTIHLKGVGLDSKFETEPSVESDGVVDDMNNLSVEHPAKTHCLDTEQTLTHDFKFMSVHPSLDNDQNETPFVSTHHCMASCLVDYIFVSKDQVTDSRPRSLLKCLSFQRLPNAAEIDRLGLLPNNLIGSDHLSMNAQFVITPNELQ